MNLERMAKSGAEPIVLRSLISRYRRMAGHLRQREAEVARIRDTMKNLEGAIRLYNSDFSPEEARPITPRQAPRFKQGECLRLSLTVLRTAQEAMSARDISMRVLALQGVTEYDDLALKYVQQAVHTSLKRRIGKLVMVHDGHPVLWSITA